MMLPELYLHGLAQGDFELALRGLLGEDAPLSGPTVARLKEQWHAEPAVWQTRRLDELQAVYLWVDGIYVSRLGKGQSCAVGGPGRLE
jgi:hypothetical protein